MPSDVQIDTESCLHEAHCPSTPLTSRVFWYHECLFKFNVQPTNYRSFSCRWYIRHATCTQTYVRINFVTNRYRVFVYVYIRVCVFWVSGEKLLKLKMWHETNSPTSKLRFLRCFFFFFAFWVCMRETL